MQKIKLILLLVSFSTLFINCNDDDGDNTTKVFTKTLNARINNLDFNITDVQNGHLLSGNINCDKIFINTIIENNTKSYKLDFELLKNGEIVKVEFRELPENLNTYVLYSTPDYQPASSMEIKDFYFDAVTNDINFNFNGSLYRENEINTTDTKEINGSIKLNSFKSIDCSMTYTQNIEYNSNDFQFNTIHQKKTKYPNLFQNHQFTSNNGYILNLDVENDLWEMPNGTYNFSKLSLNNKISLQKYMGDLIVTPVQQYNKKDWELLETSGYFTIDNKEESGSFKNISGIIHMDVFLNNQLLFTIPNMKYNTGSFE